MVRVGVSEAATRAGGRDGRWIVHAAAEVEAAGFNSLWVPQRICSKVSETGAHPYGADGDVAVISRHGFFDSVATLAAVAVTTETLRIGTYVDLSALRHPFITAQQVATLDQLSDGRIFFGIGAGWYEEEYDLLGVPFETRGRRLTEYLRAMKELWISEVSDFQGELLRFSSVHVGPPTVQDPHPPILIGGNSQAAVERIAAVGDGWVGYGLTPVEIRDFIGRLDGALAAAGRGLDDVSLKVGIRFGSAGFDAQPDDVDRDDWRKAAEFIDLCGDLGIDEVILSARFPVEGFTDNMYELASLLEL